MWESVTGLTPNEFRKMTRFCNASDNSADNQNRALVLGFGEDVRIAPGAILRYSETITIGKKSFVGLFSYVNGDVTIGERVAIGPHCSLTARNHVFNPETQSFSSGKKAPIHVKDGAWLAAGCQITAGVTVGKCTLVCANATVTRDTPDYAIIAGVPAKQVGHIDPESGEYHWYGK